MNRMTRRDRFIGLNPMEKKLESMESLQEIILLYKANIQFNLDSITKNPVLQAQIKQELNIDW